MARPIIRVDFEGGREVEDALFALPQSTAKATMRRVLKAALVMVAEAGAANAPRFKGHLQDSYGVGTRLTRRQRALHRKMPGSKVEVFAGPGGDPAAIATEFGNDHQTAQPHLRPAWLAKWRDVLDKVRELQWDEVQKSIARYQRRVARGTAGGRR